MDAEEYATQIRRTLRTCEYLLESDPPSPAIRIYANGAALFWESKFEMIDGSTLEVRESILFRKNELASKDYRFSLRDASNALIFRFDSHGIRQEADEVCHVHVGSEENIVEYGTVGETDLPALMHCIKNHYLDKSQKWEDENE